MENARDAVKALILANDILDSAIPICYGLGLKTRPKRFGARWGCATKRSARNNPLPLRVEDAVQRGWRAPPGATARPFAIDAA